MVRSTEIPIDRKVFSQDDIVKIFDFFAAAYQEAVKAAKREFQAGLMIQLRDQENIDYTIKDDETHDEIKEFIKTKKITRIYCRFSDYPTESSIDLTLREGDSGSINIKSGDVNWLAAKKAKLEEIIKDAQSQENFYTRNHKALFVASSAYFASMYYIFLHLLPTPHERYTITLPGFTYFMAKAVFFAVLYGGGAAISIVVFGKLDKLWPDIEFNFGPEHLKHARHARNVLAVAVTAFIFPLLLMIIPLLVS